MLGKAIQPEIEGMIEAGQFDELREMLVEGLNVADVAEVIEDLDPEDEGLVFRLLPRDRALEVFELLEYESQENLIHQLSQDRVAQILNGMSPDDRTRLLEELPGEISQRLLRSLNPEALRIARSLLGYPEDSIGRLMTPEYVAVRPEWTVERTIEHIRQKATRAETINVIYVLDERGRLIDDLRLGQLLMAETSRRIDELTDNEFVALSAHDDQEIAIEAFRKYDRMALPVTDSRGVMAGIVTVDDIMDVAEEEQTEDVLRFAAQEAIEDPYFATSTFELVRKRTPWLAVLLVSSFLTVGIMQFFESYTLVLPLLAFFVPMIISTGGNSGTQSAALIIRGLAVHEIELANWWRVLVRELIMGLSMGLALGLVAAVFSYTVQNKPVAHETLDRMAVQSPAVEQAAAIHPPESHDPLRIPLLIWLSVTGVVTIGTMIGSMLPFLFKGIGLDPAVCSGPFIATFVDVSGILLLFTIFLVGYFR